MLAEKEIDRKTYEQWSKELDLVMQDQSDEKDEKLDKLYERIETGMDLVGSVAVEDKL